MTKQVILYGLGLTALIVLLKYIEYSYLVKSFSEETYIGLIALFFSALGGWLGLKWMQRKQKREELKGSKDVQLSLEVSNREMDVLIGMAEGLSNQEIADKLFVSESTVKTHSSNLFAKLNVNRRTQAVQKARETGLLA